MKVLITGASGFIGSNLANQLADNKKYKVTALVRSTSDTSKLRDEVDLFYGDITHRSSLREAVRDKEIVFHSAAALPYHNLRDEEYKKVNIDGTANLARLALKEKIKRFIHISTVGIYGKPGKNLVSEESHPNPDDIYAKTKLQAEKEIYKLGERGLRFTIIRPAIGFGEGDTRPGFIDLFKTIKRGIFVPIGDGENFFHTVYIGNLIHALGLVLDNEKSINQDFIIGDAPCPKMADVIGQVYKLNDKKMPNYYIPKKVALAGGAFGDVVGKLGISFPLNLRRVSFITENRQYSTEKAKELINYEPEYKLSEAMERTYKWYKKKDLL